MKKMYIQPQVLTENFESVSMILSGSGSPSPTPVQTMKANPIPSVQW